MKNKNSFDIWKKKNCFLNCIKVKKKYRLYLNVYTLPTLEFFFFKSRLRSWVYLVVYEMIYS